MNVGGVACVLSVRALCLHSHETSLHASACDGLDQSGEVLLAEHLPARTMAVYTYFPMAWSKEQLLASFDQPSHPVPSENANIVQPIILALFPSSGLEACLHIKTEILWHQTHHSCTISAYPQRIPGLQSQALAVSVFSSTFSSPSS